LEPFSRRLVLAPWHHNPASEEASAAMYSIFYIIGVIVVILAVLSLLGIR
jgi:uncharacterized membrane protein YkgB